MFSVESNTSIRACVPELKGTSVGRDVYDLDQFHSNPVVVRVLFCVRRTAYSRVLPRPQPLGGLRCCYLLERLASERYERGHGAGTPAPLSGPRR